MAAKFVRAPNSPVLFAAGIALLLLAVLAAGRAAANHYQMPALLLVAGHITRNAILGAALLFIALRRSQFAGATVVIVATFLTVGVALPALGSLTFGSVQMTWLDGIDLAIAVAILWPSIFPWSRSANKPVLFWVALTSGAMALLVGTVAILARL